MKIKSKIALLSIISFIIIGCNSRNNKETLIYTEKEYWSKHHTSKEKAIRSKYDVYSKNGDTIAYITNYYKSGALKSKVIMKNELLIDIEFVLDTLGNEINFGDLDNGTGYVIRYSSDNGVPTYEGQYIKGNKEGWWKNYHYRGYVTDSTLYIEGVPQQKKSLSNDPLRELINIPLKDNLYE